MRNDDAPIDAKSGRQIEHDWAVNKGLAERSWESQRRGYSDLMSDRCLEESLRLGETEWQFWQRLDKAGDILDAVWYACAPWSAKQWNDDNFSDAQRAEVKKHRQIIWVRHNATRIHDLGYEEAGYWGVDRRGLSHAAAQYLEKPWLRVPALDWVIVDALITDEIAQYGEAVKKAHLPGPPADDIMGRVDFDKLTKSNVAAINKHGRRYGPHPIRDWFGYNVLFPVVTIGASLYFEAYKTALAFVALTIFDYAFLSVRFAWRAFWRMRGTLKTEQTPKQRAYSLWLAMIDVWGLLEGPVINPSLLKAAMTKANEQGAVFESAAWAIVDRVISFDAAVWITSIPAL